MKIIRAIVLQLLLLAALCVCGTAVMKIMDLVLELSYDNVFEIGIQVGFTAWLMMLVPYLFGRKKRRK